MNLHKINFSEERQFLADSQRFYDEKNFRPDRKTIERNYAGQRIKSTFDKDDFLDHSGVDYNVVNKIYLIGLAEYKTKLTFEQFLYLAFWDSSLWKETRNYGRSYFNSRTKRYENHEFRKPHKFKKTAKTQAKELTEKERTKKEWKEYKKLNKDKAKTHAKRYNSWGRALKSFAARRERRYVKQRIHKEQETDSKISKILFDSYYYD